MVRWWDELWGSWAGTWSFSCRDLEIPVFGGLLSYPRLFLSGGFSCLLPEGLNMAVGFQRPDQGMWAGEMSV